MSVVNGIIISNKSAQTVIVSVARTMSHPKYKKIIKKTTKLAVHNDIEGLKIGDKVQIIQSRPFSKTKQFKVAKKL